MIDFCIVSSDLFSEELDVRVKRGAELSTDHHHVVVCSPGISKPWPNKQSRLRDQMGGFCRQDVRKRFISSMATTLRQLSKTSGDIEMIRLLFQTAMFQSLLLKAVDDGLEWWRVWEKNTLVEPNC